MSSLTSSDDFTIPPIRTIYFKHPSTSIVSGPTGCGKTVLVKRLIKENMFRDENNRGIDRIIWCYGTPPSDNLMADVISYSKGRAEFYKGLNEDVILNGLDEKENNLLIIDDLMQEVSNSPTIANIFTKGSHHCNMSVVYVVQNLFDRGKSSVTVAKNSHYNIIFKSPRGIQDVRSLATQLMPAGQTKEFTKFFEEVTSDPHSYLLIDCHQGTPTDYKFRTKIFPDEDTTIFIRRN